MEKILLRIGLFVLLISLLLMMNGVLVYAEDSEVPIISGETMILVVGQPYDLMDGITVTDDVDQDLLGLVNFRDEIDITTPGFFGLITG